MRRILENIVAADKLVGQALRAWGIRWGMPWLHETVTVRFNSRFRVALGRARPSLSLISLNAELTRATPEVLLEVLCHEAAHVVAYRMGAPRSRSNPPHGEDWAALVRAAGYTPRVRAPRSWIEAASNNLGTARSHQRRVAHVCPVCHARRTARRPVPAWRCAACVAVGLDGGMEVVHLPALE
jgi:predicted SprT family Zn-dependent metalloprotease